MFHSVKGSAVAGEESEAALTKARAWLEGIIASAMDAIISIDEQQRVVQFNPAAEAMFGVPSAEALGAPINRFIPGRFREAHMHEVEDFGRTGVSSRPMGARGTVTGLRANGEEFPIEASISQIEAGGEKLYTVILRDVSPRVQAEESLRLAHEQTETILRRITDGFLALDREWRFTRVNAQAERLLHKSQSELLGQNAWDLFPGAEAFRRRYEQAVDHGQAVHFDEFYPPLEAWFEVHAYSSANGLSLYFRDVTERRRAASALRESETRYRSLFESIDEGFCVIEVLFDEHDAPVDYRFLEINPAFEKHTGMAGALGKTMREMIPNHDAHWFEIYGQVARTGQAVRFENYSVTLQRWFDVHASRLGRPEERKVALLFNNITERKRAQAQLRDHAEKLEETVANRTAELREANAELEAFGYSLSHDMRGPLRAILSFTQFVMEDGSPGLSPTARSYLEKVSSAAHRLDRLILDVLDFSRLTRTQANLGPVDLEKLVRDIIHERPELQPPAAEVRIEGPLPAVRGDEASLTQCLTNLLGNAVKFVPRGATPQVRVYCEPKGDQVRLWVEDNGIGIEQQAQSRVFDLFQRGRQSNEYEGTGLGLAIVRKAAGRMGGTVGVDSELGKGSRFWLQLTRAE